MVGRPSNAAKDKHTATTAREETTSVEIAVRQAEQDLLVAEKRVIKQQLLVRATKGRSASREEAERDLTRLLEAYGLARSARDMRMHEARLAGLIVGLKAKR